MSDNRVMSSKAAAAEQHAARTAERVGDGSQLDAATFATLGLAERQHLYVTNPARYAELQTELDKAADLGRMGGAR